MGQGSPNSQIRSVPVVCTDGVHPVCGEHVINTIQQPSSRRALSSGTKQSWCPGCPLGEGTGCAVHELDSAHSVPGANVEVTSHAHKYKHIRSEHVQFRLQPISSSQHLGGWGFGGGRGPSAIQCNLTPAYSSTRDQVVVGNSCSFANAQGYGVADDCGNPLNKALAVAGEAAAAASCMETGWADRQQAQRQLHCCSTCGTYLLWLCSMHCWRAAHAPSVASAAEAELL